MGVSGLKKYSILLLLLLASIVTVSAVPMTAIQQGSIGGGTNPDNLLTMTKLATVATQVSSNPACYFPIAIYVNVTWIGGGIYTVQLPNFWLVITTPNQIIGNSTLSVFKNPDNRIAGVTMFSGIPTTLELSFTKTCLPQGVAVLPILFYQDGTYNFQFSLP